MLFSRRCFFFSLALFAIVFAGCVSPGEQPQNGKLGLSSSAVFPTSASNYAQHRYNNEVSLQLFENKILQVKHSLDYRCCAVIAVSGNVSEENGATLISLVEKDNGTDAEGSAPDACGLPCGYTVNSFFDPVAPGRYVLRVTAVEGASIAAKIVAEQSFEIRDGKILMKYEVGAGFQEDSCSQDSDCVKASCCHASSCINKNYEPDCGGIACTQECRPGTFDCGGGYCKCNEGKCGGVFTRSS